MTSVSSVVEVCNLALDRIGYPEAIGDIYEGTLAAQIALRDYAQTRDDQLRLLRPPFARRDVMLVLLKTAPPGGYVLNPWTPAYPPPPWIYEYAYPVDCLDLRAVRETPMVMPSFLPTAKLFTIANDASLVPAAKVVLTNVASAIAVYTAQVVDMTTWEATFVEAMVAALGRRFGQALGAGGDAVKGEAAEEQSTGAASMARRG
jgi:hypothetical protein